MSIISVEATKYIQAPADELYEIISDYREHHPRILPRKYFSDLVVEKGGVGAGTEIRFRVKLMGTSRKAHARIEEPKPGRLLAEHLEGGGVTTFEVAPTSGGAASRVTIRTEWERRGIRGVVERWLAVPELRKMFLAQLDQLEAYAASLRSTSMSRP